MVEGGWDIKAHFVGPAGHFDVRIGKANELCVGVEVVAGGLWGR